MCNNYSEQAEDRMAQTVDSRAEIRALGRRATRSRRAIWEVLSQTSGHVGAMEIHQQVLQAVPNMALSTVYRTIAMFEDRGLVHSVTVDGEALFGPVNEPHHHAVCIGCGTVTELDGARVDDGLLADLESASGVQPDPRSGITIRGLCQDCRDD
jgi:Fur family ferric uptake transcriptional regulator